MEEGLGHFTGNLGGKFARFFVGVGQGGSEHLKCEHGKLIVQPLKPQGIIAGRQPFAPLLERLLNGSRNMKGV
jgi:hypothetical protein